MKPYLLPAIVLAVASPLWAQETNAVITPPMDVPSAEEVIQGAQTGVSFQTSDAQLQQLFNAAEATEKANIYQFTPTMKILVEGGGYGNAWIETQPMGGEMYAKRNLEVALNNQMIFILNQRADGRLPGMMVRGNQTTPARPDYEMLQGYCFPDPAWKMYFWCGKDRGYLLKLYAALEAHDNYLWRTRNPKGDGLLETWCIWDTGEDYSTRYTTRGAHKSWPSDSPPTGKYMPFASMDVMSYSYAGRATMAKIAHELADGREDYWRQQAEDVRQKLIKGLWDSARHACFDHDCNGNPLPELIHNNLRAMYHGIFTQEMADEFIRYHLLNPDEFWTPMPLPSIAVHEALFRNIAGNNWSGQPEGLTYQRAIRALENYGHFAEVTLLGRKLIAAVGPEGNFSVQFDPFTDPFTGKPGNPNQRSYGPTILATLEYCSLMNGINLDVEHGQVWWSGLADGGENYTYTQRWNDRTWTLTCDYGEFTAQLNGSEVFSCTAGVRVVTDLDGKVIEIVGINPVPQSVTLNVGIIQHKLTVSPNQVYGLDGTVLHAAPFDYPYHNVRK
jgi:hypothetical protein